MIGFGELRKRSLEWRSDIAVVERAYAIDWLLKGIFDQPLLADAFVLRGSSALRYAYRPDYPLAEPPEFFLRQDLDPAVLEQALGQALAAGATASGGLSFSLDRLTPAACQVEFVGPLGRRSAAQPHLVLPLTRGRPRLAPILKPLVHPFDDPCPATLQVVALEELIGERWAILGHKPRARDVFDLWFAIRRQDEHIEWDRAAQVAEEVARAKSLPFPGSDAVFDPAHRVTLERTWEAALGKIREHPSLAQVEDDLRPALKGPGRRSP